MLGPSRRCQGARNNSGHLRELLAFALSRVTNLKRVVMAGHGLGEPPLAPAIMLAFAERFAPALGYAEVEFLDVFIFGECLSLTVHHHAAVFENVAVARKTQRHVGVLFG